MSNKIINKNTITVGDLIKHLEVFDKDAEIHFEGHQFQRTKYRGEKLVQIELTENEYGDDAP